MLETATTRPLARRGTVDALRRGLAELWVFGAKNAISCLFPLVIFAALAFSKEVGVPGIARYDFVLVVCLATQAAMLAAGLESVDELKVICVFHVLGLGLELFKVHVGSWSYPERALFEVGGVPLYSGFMYASVAGFMIQAWRRFDLRLERWPRMVVVVPLGAAIYLNFFTHHHPLIPDLRWALIGLVVIVLFRAKVRFTTYRRTRRMRLPVAFVLIGLFVFVAENVATFFGAWQYPHQGDTWSPVHLAKLSSWSLLVIVSFLIVAELKRVKRRRDERAMK